MKTTKTNPDPAPDEGVMKVACQFGIYTTSPCPNPVTHRHKHAHWRGYCAEHAAGYQPSDIEEGMPYLPEWFKKTASPTPSAPVADEKWRCNKCGELTNDLSPLGEPGVVICTDCAQSRKLIGGTASAEGAGTPRTEAMSELVFINKGTFGSYHRAVVTTDFARTIERELHEEKRGRESARQSFLKDLGEIRAFADNKEREARRLREENQRQFSALYDVRSLLSRLGGLAESIPYDQWNHDHMLQLIKRAADKADAGLEALSGGKEGKP